MDLGLIEKRKGKASAAKHHGEALEIARDIARSLASQNGTVAADEVQELMRICKYGNLGNSAGSIFDTGEFEPVGYRPSTRTSRHGAIIRVWRLRCPR